MLRMEGVGKTFPVRRTPVHALREVTLTVPAGKLTSILGASGSGKSTLLRVVAGFEHSDGGRVLLDGRELSGPGTFVRPEHRGIGMVPQDGALFPHLDVAGNVAFGLTRAVIDRPAPTRRRARAARVEELLALVGLEGYQRRRVDQLSGGQQQRVALARALAPSPRVILLDEPFSAIDAALRTELGVEVRNLLRGLEITTVLVTHDQEEALSLADQVVVMREGRVVQTGAPREVYRHPVDVDTARFVGDAVVLDGTVLARDGVEARVDCVLGRLSATLAGTGCHTTDSSPMGRECRVIVRPESMRMDTVGTPAVVVSTQYYGHDAMTTLRLGPSGDGPTVWIRTSDGDGLPLPGAAVGVQVVDPVLVVPAV